MTPAGTTQGGAQQVQPALAAFRALPLGLQLSVVALVYVGAARLGLTMAFGAEQVTPVWPPTGIALAALLLLGLRAWPAIFVGAVVSNVTIGTPIWIACGIASGNTLEALTAAWLLRFLRVDAALTRVRDVLLLILAGSVVSSAVSATIGVASLCLGGVQPWEASPRLWGVWWIGDAGGDLIVAPLLLVWASLPQLRWPRWRILEALALLAGVVGVSLAAFVGAFGLWRDGYPLHYTIFPLVIAGALRFGHRGATTATFVASALAIWSTVHGFGPFATGGIGERLVMVQLFMAVVAITALLLSAAIGERNAADRQRADDFARLAESEQRLRLAFEAAQMGVWEWDIQSGAVRWSDNLETLHGVVPGSFTGTFEGFRALVHPDDRELVSQAIARAVELRAGYDIEFRTVQADGRVRWMSGKGQVFTDDRGRAKRMMGLAMDVSDRKRLEDELRQRAGELADADRRKDEFLAMLAHELRNPLAPLSNALHLLERGGDRDRIREIAERQVRHLARLVDDLLDASRITQGKISLRKERLLLSDVVTRAVEMMREALDARGDQLTVSMPSRPVRLEADAARLAQVLANLLSNAAKFTPSGGSIWLTAEPLDGEVVIRVRDTGVGLAPDLLPNVFDLFVQGDASLDRTRGGLGIGLTLVKRLVEMHGGRVEARSPGLGQGSEFLVYLPTVESTMAESAVRPPEAPPPQTSAQGLRIVIVEDNHDAAESMAMILGLWGHEVEIAFDAMAALQLAERAAPDVIISDLGLPGMSGYDLAKRLRQERTFGRVVLIALSGYAREDDKRRALAAGFDH
ncbi:MAG TPA: MASE1 domain-containing protein, partial [Candidatus Binatia bacterium]